MMSSVILSCIERACVCVCVCVCVYVCMCMCASVCMCVCVGEQVSDGEITCEGGEYEGSEGVE